MQVDSSSQWAIRVRTEQSAALGSLRLFTGLKVLVDGSSVWLRGDAVDADLARKIRSIPDAEQFEVWPDGQIVPIGSTVPCARLPQGDWLPLNEWFGVELPTAGFAGSLTDKLTLRLVRVSKPMVANLLQTTWPAWRDYALQAPQVRLNRLAFAVSDDQRTLVRGSPLPPISGRRFCESSGVVVPAGWQFEPKVGSLVAAQALKLDESELALFDEDGSFERVPRSAFVQATRSAVRATNG